MTTYDNRFTELDAIQRDILTIVSHDEPQRDVDIKATLEVEMGITFTYRRLYLHLNTLVERVLVAKNSIDEGTPRYEITEEGRHALRHYHSWFRSTVDLQETMLGDGEPMRLRYTVASGRSRSIAAQGDSDE